MTLYKFSKVILLLIFVVQIVSCSTESKPEFNEVKESLLKNINIYEELSQKSLDLGVDRINLTDVYPKGSISTLELQWFHKRFEVLGLDVGLQVYKTKDKKRVVEFIYWSTGIVSRGEVVIITRSEVNLNEIDFYRKKIADNEMKCKLVKSEWSVCYL
jgi:hypothetical protein